MSVEDDDLSDLERKMRANLFKEAPGNGGLPSSQDFAAERERVFGKAPDKGEAFVGEERRIAERIVGIDNLTRISRARGTRPLRAPLPVKVHYEWYYFRFGGGWDGERENWRINRVENGQRRSQHAEGHWQDDLQTEVEALRAKGFTVIENAVDRPRKTLDQPKQSAKKAILNDLRYFRR